MRSIPLVTNILALVRVVTMCVGVPRDHWPADLRIQPTPSGSTCYVPSGSLPLGLRTIRRGEVVHGQASPWCSSVHPKWELCCDTVVYSRSNSHTPRLRWKGTDIHCTCYCAERWFAMMQSVSQESSDAEAPDPHVAERVETMSFMSSWASHDRFASSRQ
ncbi:hypothetical protein C8Q74DRAFT_766520 [Fomes fomentarius]|nr:hypothetical protein C8Q74DRAFT_766520 [Fomes fomentarius]